MVSTFLDHGKVEAVAAELVLLDEMPLFHQHQLQVQAVLVSV